jgi:predicted DNA-binding mobile mystery protein A
MTSKFNVLKKNQVKARLSSLRENDLIPRPQVGWIRFIREALGMSSKALAHRLGVTPATMSETEKAELDESLTLKRLRRVADGMNCELVYYLLPREDVSVMVKKRAEHVAREKVMQMQLNMEYEDQAVREEFLRELVEAEVRRLMNSKKLWDE